MSPAVPAHPPRRCQKSKVSKRGVVLRCFFFFPFSFFGNLHVVALMRCPYLVNQELRGRGCSQRGAACPGRALRPPAHIVPPSRSQQSPTEAQDTASPGAV